MRRSRLDRAAGASDEVGLGVVAEPEDARNTPKNEVSAYTLRDRRPERGHSMRDHYPLPT